MINNEEFDKQFNEELTKFTDNAIYVAPEVIKLFIKQAKEMSNEKKQRLLLTMQNCKDPDVTLKALAYNPENNLKKPPRKKF
jgi:hypothetical protein